MRISKRKEEVLLVPEGFTDLWLLSKIVGPGDEVEAETKRAVDFAGGQERKKVRVRLRVEKVELGPGHLRLLGVITWGRPEEFVQRGRHHSLKIEKGKAVVLHRSLTPGEEKWLRRSSPSAHYVVLADDSEVEVWEAGEVLKRLFDGVYRRDDEYDFSWVKVLSPSRPVLVLGSSFGKEKVAEVLRNEGFRVKVGPEVLSVYEALRRGILRGFREAEEEEALEILTEGLWKERVSYGRDFLEDAKAGRLKLAAILPDFFLKHREECYSVLETGGRLVLAETSEGLRAFLRSLGGAAGLRRW